MTRIYIYASLGVEGTNNDDDDCNKTRTFRLLIRYQLTAGQVSLTIRERVVLCLSSPKHKLYGGPLIHSEKTETQGS